MGPDKRKELVKGLREKGIEDGEVREALNAWTIEQEEKVEAAGGAAEARIGFEIARAKLYVEGDYIEEALDTLYEALYVVQQEGRNEFEEKLRKEIALLEAVE